MTVICVSVRVALVHVSGLLPNVKKIDEGGDVAPREERAAPLEARRLPLAWRMPPATPRRPPLIPFTMLMTGDRIAVLAPTIPPMMF